jgi:hypothetical protein
VCVCVCVCVYVSGYIYIYFIYIYVYIYMRVHIYRERYTYMYVCIYVYIYTHIYIHIHIYTYTYTFHKPSGSPRGSSLTRTSHSLDKNITYLPQAIRQPERVESYKNITFIRQEHHIPSTSHKAIVLAGPRGSSLALLGRTCPSP